MKTFLLFTLLPVHIAIAGGEVGNGGQDVALEFSTYGFTAAGQIEKSFYPGAGACLDAEFKDLCSLDAERVRDAVRSARILALPELTQQDPSTGKTLAYVALNFPQEQRILVSEAEWARSEFCYVKRLPLVLHEYLGLLGLEIQNYRYSSLLSVWLMKTAGEDKFQGCPELNSKGDRK